MFLEEALHPLLSHITRQVAALKGSAIADDYRSGKRALRPCVAALSDSQGASAGLRNPMYAHAPTLGNLSVAVILLAIVNLVRRGAVR